MITFVDSMPRSDNEHLQTVLARFIIKRALPFNVFDNEDFESFFKQFRPFPLVKQLQKLI